MGNVFGCCACDEDLDDARYRCLSDGGQVQECCGRSIRAEKKVKELESQLLMIKLRIEVLENKIRFDQLRKAVMPLKSYKLPNESVTTPYESSSSSQHPLMELSVLSDNRDVLC